MELRECLTRMSEQDISLILSRYLRAIRKYSYCESRFDEDLYGEQVLAVLKCIRRFQADEVLLTKLYYENIPAGVPKSNGKPHAFSNKK